MHGGTICVSSVLIDLIYIIQYNKVQKLWIQFILVLHRVPCGGDHGDEWIQRPRDGDGDDDEDFCYAVYADWNSQLTFRQAEKNCTAQVPIYQE